MRTPHTHPKATPFGAGTYTQRHQQHYQAITGAVVISIAVATLALHHFGFGLALVIALGAAAVCAAGKVRATVSVYVVGLALLAGILITPMQATQDYQLPLGASIMPMAPAHSGELGYEMYVLEEPILDRLELHSVPFEWESEQEPQDSFDNDSGSTQIPTPYSRQIFEL